MHSSSLESSRNKEERRRIHLVCYLYIYTSCVELDSLLYVCVCVYYTFICIQKADGRVCVNISPSAVSIWLSCWISRKCRLALHIYIKSKVQPVGVALRPSKVNSVIYLIFCAHKSQWVKDRDKWHVKLNFMKKGMAGNIFCLWSKKTGLFPREWSFLFPHRC